MTQFKHKAGTGSLFKNKYKTTDLHPDFNGKIILSKSYKEGEELKISGWIKSSTNGIFLSLAENTFIKETPSEDELWSSENKLSNIEA